MSAGKLCSCDLCRIKRAGTAKEAHEVAGEARERMEAIAEAIQEKTPEAADIMLRAVSGVEIVIAMLRVYCLDFARGAIASSIAQARGLEDEGREIKDEAGRAIADVCRDLVAIVEGGGEVPESWLH